MILTVFICVYMYVMLSHEFVFLILSYVYVSGCVYVCSVVRVGVMLRVSV